MAEENLQNNTLIEGKRYINVIDDMVHLAYRIVIVFSLIILYVFLKYAVQGGTSLALEMLPPFIFIAIFSCLYPLFSLFKNKEAWTRVSVFAIIFFIGWCSFLTGGSISSPFFTLFFIAITVITIFKRNIWQIVLTASCGFLGYWILSSPSFYTEFPELKHPGSTYINLISTAFSLATSAFVSIKTKTLIIEAYNEPIDILCDNDTCDKAGQACDKLHIYKEYIKDLLS